MILGNILFFCILITKSKPHGVAVMTWHSGIYMSSEKYFMFLQSKSDHIRAEEEACGRWNPWEKVRYSTRAYSPCRVWSTSECWEERLQSLPLFLAEFPWLTSADCLGSPLSPLLRTQRRVKMLLSVPPRTGINPYNGYTGKNSKRVSNNTTAYFCPLFLSPLTDFSMRCLFELCLFS